MELAGSQSVEQCREAPHQARGGDSSKRLVLGEPKLIDAVGVKARAGPDAVNAACFDLSEVSQKLSRE
jgi:hypothetical protein